MARIKRRLGKKMQEDQDLRPELPELVPPPVTIDGYPYPPSSGERPAQLAELWPKFC